MGKVKILTKVVMFFGLVLFSPFLGQHLYISYIYCVFHTAISPLSSTVCFYTHSEYPFSQHPVHAYILRSHPYYSRENSVDGSKEVPLAQS